MNYKSTTVYGKITNLAIGKGIPNALVVLKSYSEGGFLLPDKAQIELQTRTDADGNYIFTFDAYKHWLNKNKKGSYSVEYMTEGKLIDLFSGEGGSGNTVNLMQYFNDDLLTFQRIENLGENNQIDINVVLNGRVFFQFYNDKPVPTIYDSLEVFIENKFTDYFQTATANIDQTQNNSFLIKKPYSLTSGENTISYYITKNGAKTRVDTTFFVEPKDYYINFHF
jgi:hypothetical protein